MAWTRTHEHPLRSLAKAISWRVIASLDTFGLAYLIAVMVDWTGNMLGFAAAISLAEAVTKTVHYWVHERVWARIQKGLQ